MRSSGVFTATMFSFKLIVFLQCYLCGAAPHRLCVSLWWD
jgi:hypothetical protein